MPPQPAFPAPRRGWAALLTLLLVLVCAAPAGSVPVNRMLGSAFDPASASVALRPQKPAVPAKVRKAVQRDPVARVEPRQAAALFVLAEPLPQVSPAPVAALVAIDVPEPGRRVHPLGARAPPTA